MTTHTERTYKYLKDLGLEWGSTFDKAEHWNQWSKTRKDLFNTIDIVVLYNGIIGLQVCGSDWQEHIRKIEENESTKHWLNQGGRLVLMGWRQLKVKRGGKAMKWTPRFAEFFIIDDKIIIKEQENL